MLASIFLLPAQAASRQSTLLSWILIKKLDNKLGDAIQIWNYQSGTHWLTDRGITIKLLGDAIASKKYIVASTGGYPTADTTILNISPASRGWCVIHSSCCDWKNIDAQLYFVWPSPFLVSRLFGICKIRISRAWLRLVKSIQCKSRFEVFAHLSRAHRGTFDWSSFWGVDKCWVNSGLNWGVKFWTAN